MLLEYVGEDEEWHNLYPEAIVKFEKGKTYEVELIPESDEPQVIINGQQVFRESDTLWINLAGTAIAVPYAANLLSNFWKVN